MTGPELRADADLELAREALAHVRRRSPAPPRSARSAWSGSRSGAPNTASSPSPTNLLAWPPWAIDARDDLVEERVEPADDLARAGALGQRGEAAHVEEQDADLDLLALERDALGEHALGDVRVDVDAERLAQPLALGQPGDRLVERLRELAGLVGRRDRHARGEVARRRCGRPSAASCAIGSTIERASRTVSSSETVKATTTATATSTPRSRQRRGARSSTGRRRRRRR